MILDERLKDFATDTQAKYLDAVNLYGGYRAAERALGLSNDVIGLSIRRLQKHAALHGYAPGNWDHQVAPGYVMGKVTVQRGPDGVERRWERQHPEATDIIAKVREAIDALKEEIPAAKSIRGPRLLAHDLLTQYTVTDYHIGMQAHASEGDNLGADWNLGVAEELLVQAISALVAQSPNSEVGLLALLGDLLHFDGPDPVTPTHQHPLDTAGRPRTMIRVVVRAIRRVVQVMLQKHGRVVIVVAEGNHDITSTNWLAELLMAEYRNEPRVEVLDYDLPYYAYRFGRVMLGFHHGHKKSKESLPLLFATLFREMWGQVRKVYIHCGHQHHVDEKEHSGAKVIQHPTMAAPDSHALRGGWFSEREMSAIHYHAEYGQVGRSTVTPEMLAA